MFVRSGIKTAISLDPSGSPTLSAKLSWKN